jgi:hypothetical protein
MINTIAKPHLNEFFLRGIPLREALSLLARWEELRHQELAEYGFNASAATEERVEARLKIPRSSMN